MSWIAVVDVSENQGHIDFGKMHQGGIRHIIIRCAINGRRDKRLDEYVVGARAAGIGVCALYTFVNPKSTATAEAQGRLALQCCRDYGVKTHMLDLEWYTTEGGPNPVLSGQPYNDYVHRFVDQMQEVVNIIYTAPSFWNRWAALDNDFGRMDTIIANYKWQSDSSHNDGVVQGVHPDDWAAVVFNKSGLPNLPIGWDTTLEGWQFSAGYNKQGPVYGASSGDLDLNLVDPAALSRWYGGSPYVPIPPQPQGDDMAVTIFEAIDAAGNRWANAVFAGEFDGRLCRRVERIDGETLAGYRANGAKTINRGPGGFATFGLDGSFDDLVAAEQAAGGIHQWSRSEFRNTNPAPIPGPPGGNVNLTANALTLPPGSAATAVVTGNSPDLVLTIGVPAGQPGDTGDGTLEGSHGAVITFVPVGDNAGGGVIKPNGAS